ncbi:hypothetical protein [Streptomyces sp. NPDC102282]|uniref:hypothetical protein n=1 Tax=Streptomyces sp. NPDC102282 TaxID=3366154 RepID=UPI00382E4BED
MGRFSTDTEGVAHRLRDGMADGVLSLPLTGFREDGGRFARIAEEAGAGAPPLMPHPLVAAPQLDTGPGLVGAPRRRTV